MSRLDEMRAKEALTWRLKEWGVANPSEMAAGFIDDLVQQGWQMNPSREARPVPPTRSDECPKHPGQHENWCGLCRVELLTGDENEPATEPTGRPASAETKSAALADIRAALGRKGPTT